MDDIYKHRERDNKSNSSSDSTNEEEDTNKILKLLLRSCWPIYKRTCSTQISLAGLQYSRSKTTAKACNFKLHKMAKIFHVARRTVVMLLCILSIHPISSGISPVAASASSSSSSSPYGQELKSWIQARCGNPMLSSQSQQQQQQQQQQKDKVAIWVYEGALFDPLEGRKIANVEGVELVQHVKDKTNGNVADLEVGPLLSNPNATYDCADTIFSRKLFCYSPSSSSSGKDKQLLRQIRLRPNAPVRKIPTQQAVAAYDTATTFISRGPELIAHTEWPDRQSIWGRALRHRTAYNTKTSSTDNRPKQQVFEYTIYARQKAAKKHPDQLFDLTKPSQYLGARQGLVGGDNKYDDDNDDAEVAAAPQRAKLIEFGSGSSNSKDKFGARETYSYTYDDPQTSKPNLLQQLFRRRKPSFTTISNCQVRYSRYGEGPPFFGPGRICTLELQGRRVASIAEIPPLTASIIRKRMSPDQFFNPSTSNWRLQGEKSLQVAPASDEPKDFWLPDIAKEQGKLVWTKVKNFFERSRA